MTATGKPATPANSGNLLFRAKLNIPGLQQKLIGRTRIDRALDEGLQNRLILVTAPAGFGKTTAVVKWASQSKIPVAWFSIDTSDNSLKIFWNYLIAALEGILPGIESRFYQYFHSSSTVAVQGVVTALIDELSKLERELILVFDDYHLIDEDSIHESMRLFTQYMPKGVHLVIISRSQVSFNSVRMQVAGHVKEINMLDLQFTADEIAALCRENGIILVPDELEVLKSQTEGWATGLYLLLDLVRAGDNTLLSVLNWDSHRIASYLTEEVVNRWSEEEKDFMLKTSVLSAMSGSLCDALTGRSDGKAMLARLSNQNAFVISLDQEGNWYRYHHLFGEFLQNQLESSGQVLRKALYEQAGTWFEKAGYFSEGVFYYLKGCSYEKAADLIENIGREFLKIGDTKTLLQWLGNLPSAVFEYRYMLCLTYAWALVLADRVHEAIVWVEKVATWLKGAIEASTDSDVIKQMRGEVEVVRAFIGIQQRDSEMTLQSAENCRKILQQKESLFIAYGLNFNIGEVNLLGGLLGMKGNLSVIDNEFSTIFEKSRNYMRHRYGYIPIMLGQLLFERNRVDEAFHMAMQGVNEAEKRFTVGSFVPSVITLARIMKAKGDIKGAFAVLNDGENKLKEMGSVHMLPVMAAFRARVNIETGVVDAAEEWMSNNCLSLFDTPGISNMYEHITLCRVLIAKKDYDRCMLFLVRLLFFAKKQQHLPYTLELLNLQAMIFCALGDTRRSMEVLKEALILGEKEGYERIFIEEGFPMALLLGRFIKWNLKQEHSGQLPISPVYVRRLIKANREYCITLKTCMRKEPNNETSVPCLKEPLTKREKDVLRLLMSELTNAEIAYTLGITVNTVKVNCSNIYRKLEVKNREQAVRHARELNVVS